MHANQGFKIHFIIHIPYILFINLINCYPFILLRFFLVLHLIYCFNSGTTELTEIALIDTAVGNGVKEVYPGHTDVKKLVLSLTMLELKCG